jgi:hypothetical protein
MYYRYNDFKKWMMNNILNIVFIQLLISVFIIIMLEFVFSIEIFLEGFSLGFVVILYVTNIFFKKKIKNHIDMVIEIFLLKRNYKKNEIKQYLEDVNIKFIEKYILMINLFIPLPILSFNYNLNIKKHNLFVFIYWIICFSIMIIYVTLH